MSEDSLKQKGEDSLKQKALDEIAQMFNYDNWEEAHKDKEATYWHMGDLTMMEIVDETLRVVFLWADKKEKEDKSILAKYVLELEATRGRRHKDIKKRRFEIRGKLEAWREIKKELKE